MACTQLALSARSMVPCAADALRVRRRTMHGRWKDAGCCMSLAVRPGYPDDIVDVLWTWGDRCLASDWRTKENPGCVRGVSGWRTNKYQGCVRSARHAAHTWGIGNRTGYAQPHCQRALPRRHDSCAADALRAPCRTTDGRWKGAGWCISLAAGPVYQDIASTWNA